MRIDPVEIVSELYETDEANAFDDPGMGPMYDRPMVAVASAQDPWFGRFKEVIGEFHWTPAEALALSSPGAEARSVISWCLPIAESAREANRRETAVPSRPWAYVRTYGEEMMGRMRRGLVRRLQGAALAAAAPHESPDNRIGPRRLGQWASCWSERHVAFVAGLGTFGLSGGLITARGVAHRLGSVVTDAEIAPTARPYGDDPFAWCLQLAGSACGKCIRRCPTTAIGPTVEDRDKDACYQWTYERVRGRRGLELFGWEGAYGCGLCQTAVPCEERNPTAE